MAFWAFSVRFLCKRRTVFIDSVFAFDAFSLCSSFVRSCRHSCAAFAGSRRASRASPSDLHSAADLFVLRSCFVSSACLRLVCGSGRRWPALTMPEGDCGTLGRCWLRSQRFENSEYVFRLGNSPKNFRSRKSVFLLFLLQKFRAG